MKRLAIVAAIVVPLWLAFGPVGAARVYAACVRDGGVRILEPVRADGFWFKTETPDDYCALCNEVVAKGEFKYADFESRGSRLPKDLRKGFYRVSLGQLGDAGCWYYRRVSGLSPEHCLVFTRLEGAPSLRYAMQSEYRGVGSYEAGTHKPRAYSQILYTISDVANNRPVATYRRYTYLLPFAQLLYQRSPRYACPVGVLRRDRFLVEVLGQPDERRSRT